MRTFLAALSLCVLATTMAQARTRPAADLSVFDRHAVNGGFVSIQTTAGPAQRRSYHRRHIRKTYIPPSAHHVRRAAKYDRRGERRIAARGASQFLPHPAGCPRVSFCGCGAALEVFGRPIRELWLAANWFRFPEATPAPGRVAVRRHHVFVIREVMDHGMVLAYDANSGGHRTRLHVRSLSGFRVVDPHAGKRYASAR